MKMSKGEWWWVVLYTIYVFAIFGMAGYWGAKPEKVGIPGTLDNTPVIEEVKPPEPAITAKTAVTPKVQDIRVEPPGDKDTVKYYTVKIMEPNNLDNVTPIDVMEQQDKIIVALAGELVKTTQELAECEGTVEPTPCELCAEKFSETTDEERELMMTNAIEHSRYLGQKMWEKIECERSNGC